MKPYHWTEAQWIEYNTRTVTVSFELFDRLTQATEIVWNGKQLTRNERKGWLPTLVQAKETTRPVFDDIHALR